MSVIIYQDHIEILEEENAELLKEVKILRRKLAYYKTVVEEKKMSGDPSLKEPVIFYSEELTNTKIVLLKLKGIKLNYVEDEEE